MKIFACLLFTAGILSLQSCRDTPEEVVPEPVAGKGGNATLSIISKHHNAPIDSITVYIKYNSQDAATSYDDSAVAVMTGGQPTAVFTGLKTGKYYMVGLGWDPSISRKVRGGIPYTITEEKQLTITLPVTEDH